ncbi:fungal-specific transcription factor domain-containing protein [Trichoderma velutinum]
MRLGNCFRILFPSIARQHLLSILHPHSCIPFDVMLQIKLPSCRTCKDRKIRCDKEQPICYNCRKSGKFCRYGESGLSWPAEGNNRRLIVGGTDHSRTLVAEPRFINVSLKDIEGAASPNRGFWHIERQRDEGKTQMGMANFMPRYVKNATEAELLDYFCYVAPAILPQLNSETNHLRDVLIRISLQDDSASSRAVLFSLLSLASIHRNGTNPQGTILKAQALKALQNASNTKHMQASEVHQHLAASLLLCHVEISLSSEATSFWGLYVCGAKKILKHIFRWYSTSSVTKSFDGALLYRSLHYHDVVSRFSLRHWRNPRSQDHLTIYEEGTYVYKIDCKRTIQMIPGAECLLDEVKLLDDIVSHAAHLQADQLPPHRHDATLPDIEKRVRELYSLSRQQLVNTDIVKHLDGSFNPPTTCNTLLSHRESRGCLRMHLFIIATWIYFERTLCNLAGASDSLTRMLNEAFSLLSYSRELYTGTEMRHFPFALFVIGAEARNDDERRVVLDVMAQMVGRISGVSISPAQGPSPAQNLRSLGMKVAEELAQSFWILRDLHDSSEGYFDYNNSLHQIVSNYERLPSLL